MDYDRVSAYERISTAFEHALEDVREEDVAMHKQEEEIDLFTTAKLDHKCISPIKESENSMKHIPSD